MFDFQSFTGLLDHMETCILCNNTCVIEFEFCENEDSWFHIHDCNINKEYISVSGMVFKCFENDSISTIADTEKSKFEIKIPILKKKMILNDYKSGLFPKDYFEFFISSKCDCSDRFVTSEDIIVENGVMSNFHIDSEIIFTKDYCIKIYPDEYIYEISTQDDLNTLCRFNIDSINLNFKNIDDVNTKLNRLISIS